MARELLSARSLEVAVKAAAERADAKKTRVKVRDGDSLLLIVRPGGGASWVLEYQWAGKRRPLTLGAWPHVGLKLARELAARAREGLARGIDPMAAKASRAEAEAKAKAKADTVRAMFLDWLAMQSISEVYRGNINAAFVKDVLPAIGSMAPAEVTRSDIVAILRTIEARGAPEMLRRVRMWLKQLWEFGLDAERVQSSPVPTGHLKSFMPPQPKPFPAITDAEQVPPLMRAIRAYPQPIVRTALLFSAYVWQRPSEIREATWSEFDLDAARWVIPAERMKLRREHWVPLAPEVVKLLRRHQGVVGTEGWLWPGQRYGKPVSEATLGAALEHMGFKGVHTPHGFRAMARTILEERLGFDPAPLEKQLAHEVADKVQRAYNRAQHWDARVAVMNRWADWLDEQR